MALYTKQHSAEKEESITTKRSNFIKRNHSIHGITGYSFFLEKLKKLIVNCFLLQLKTDIL